MGSYSEARCVSHSRTMIQLQPLLRFAFGSISRNNEWGILLNILKQWRYFRIFYKDFSQRLNPFRLLWMVFIPWSWNSGVKILEAMTDVKFDVIVLFHLVKRKTIFWNVLILWMWIGDDSDWLGKNGKRQPLVDDGFLSMVYFLSGRGVEEGITLSTINVSNFLYSKSFCVSWY